MTITTPEIIARLEAMEKALSDKNFIAPRARIWIGTDPNLSNTIALEYCTTSDWSSRASNFVTLPMGKLFDPLEGIHAILDAGDSFIMKLTSPEEEHRNQVLAKLGRLIDEMREVGIEAPILNPLEAAMRKLSENIITHVAAE